HAIVALLTIEVVRRADAGLAADVSHRNPVAALLQNERLLRFRKLRCLHRLPLLPARESDAENSTQKRSSLPGADQAAPIQRQAPWSLTSGPDINCSERRRQFTQKRPP